MTLLVRKSVKALLLNNNDELLLIRANDPKTTSADGVYHGPFWYLAGGKLEQGETLQEAAIREIKEETGIDKLTLGPIVWHGSYNLRLNGTLTHMQQTFIVARTPQTTLAPTALTEWEKTSITDMAWFSLEKIQNFHEIIYPTLLPSYLPDIIAGNYPSSPIELDLAAKQ